MIEPDVVKSRYAKYLRILAAAKRRNDEFEIAWLKLAMNSDYDLSFVEDGRYRGV